MAGFSGNGLHDSQDQGLIFSNVLKIILQEIK